MMDGVINILKPPGMTSSNVVSDVRRILSEKRIGHTGTLDPGAAGVLPVCVGRATRLFDYLVDKKKEYIAEVCFGISTDTQDSYGEITDRRLCEIHMRDLSQVLPGFLGEISQIAPMYSAVSVNGTRLYKLAREGVEVERAVRRVLIYDLQIISQTAKNRFLLRIQCSKGTYIRTLCYDIGRSLGVPAHMSLLIRTASGEFTIDSAITLPELSDAVKSNNTADCITPTDKAISFLPEINIDNHKHLHRLVNGVPICVDTEHYETPLRVYGKGAFLGIGRISDSKLKMCVLFAQ